MMICIGVTEVEADTLVRAAFHKVKYSFDAAVDKGTEISETV